MKTIDKNTQVMLLNKFKGLDEPVINQLSSQVRDDFTKLTIKELMIFAESGQTGGASKLLTIFEGSSVTANDLVDINALVEFGKLFTDLPNNLKIIAKKGEIQDESNHFSRIMGLDQVLSNSFKLPVSKDEAKAMCKEFARFVWLLFERRNQNQKAQQYNLKIFPQETQGNIKFENSDAIITRNKTENLVAIVSLINNPSGTILEEFKEIVGVFERFIAANGLDIAVCLLDYFLFLIGSSLRLKFIVCQEIKLEDNASQVKIIGTGGVVFAVKQNADFSLKPIQKFTLNDDVNSTVGKFNPSLVNQLTAKLSSTTKLFVVPLDSSVIKLSVERFVEILNMKNLSNKIIPLQNLITFFNNTNDTGVFTQLKCGSPSFSQKNIATQETLDIPDQLLNTDQITIESAHIHADREIAETQLETVQLRNEFVTKLKVKGFAGIFIDVVLIDEYHVVNRLDYQKYISEIQKNGFAPSEIIPESSPVIRDIAIDILLTLKKQKPNQIFNKGTNIYMSLPNQKVVELVEDLGGKNVIGCVLFDVAFTLYKKAPSLFMDSFNQKYNLKTGTNIHQEMIDFYNQELNPIKRKSFSDQKQMPIPDLTRGLNPGGYIDLVQGKNNQVVNIHEIFYRPQQAKVNAILEALGLPKLFTVYLNPQTNTVLIEQSTV